MPEEIFKLIGKTGEIKALGINVDAKPAEIKVFINGVDVTKLLSIEEIKIVKEVKP
jgi:hypothetical protein